MAWVIISFLLIISAYFSLKAVFRTKDDDESRREFITAVVFIAAALVIFALMSKN